MARKKSQVVVIAAIAGVMLLGIAIRHFSQENDDTPTIRPISPTVAPSPSETRARRAAPRESETRAAAPNKDETPPTRKSPGPRPRHIECVDAKNRPVAGARIALWRRGEVMAPVTTTNAKGRASLGSPSLPSR